MSVDYDFVIDITPGAELPTRNFIWQSGGQPINFITDPHEFLMNFKFPSGVVTKNSGISGAADGTVSIALAVDETNDWPPGRHKALLWAKRVSDGKDREPVRFRVNISQP